MAIITNDVTNDRVPSELVRLATGDGDWKNLGLENGSALWPEEISLDNGTASITRTFNFVTTDAFRRSSSGSRPQMISPLEIIKADGFPVKYSPLPEDTRYKYYGNGTIRHCGYNSHNWVYEAEYTMSDPNADDDGFQYTADTPPWKKKPENVSVSFPEISIPFTAAFDLNGNLYKLDERLQTHRRWRPVCPVINAAGDPLQAMTVRYLFQLDFTYNVQASQFSVNKMMECQGSINKNKIKILGITFPALSAMVTLHPQYVDTYSDSTNSRHWKYWQIQATIQCDAYNENSFFQKLMNVGNRAFFAKASWVDGTGHVRDNPSTVDLKTRRGILKGQIYSWWSWALTDKGGERVWSQCAPTSELQFGNRALVLEAKQKFEKLANGLSFAYEEQQNIPLTKYGTVDKDAVDPSNARFADYIVYEYNEHPVTSWNGLNMPKSGVDW